MHSGHKIYAQWVQNLCTVGTTLTVLFALRCGGECRLSLCTECNDGRNWYLKVGDSMVTLLNSLLFYLTRLINLQFLYFDSHERQKCFVD